MTLHYNTQYCTKFQTRKPIETLFAYGATRCDDILGNKEKRKRLSFAHIAKHSIAQNSKREIQMKRLFAHDATRCYVIVPDFKNEKPNQTTLVHMTLRNIVQSFKMKTDKNHHFAHDATLPKHNIVQSLEM